MKSQITVLNDSDISILETEFEAITITNDLVLVPENQIPTSSVILIQGKIEIIRDDKLNCIVNPLHMLGISQMIQERPVKFGCKIKANSKVIILGKSQILKNLKDRKSHISKILLSHLATDEN